MPRQPRVKSNSGYYHIMIRGNERQNIFRDEEDKFRFLNILCEKKQENRFNLHVYCLMDNHVHLMLSEGTEDVANVMKRVNVSYVYYFNKKYKRIGHLFQDRFKSEVVERDAYVLALARYIHQNPVKAGIVTYMEQYKWSSYLCYLDQNNDFDQLLEKETILSYFSKDKEKAKEQFKEYMNEKTQEEFLDIQEKQEEIDEGAAKELFKKMLQEKGIIWNDEIKKQLPDDLIREFKERTNLSIRRIAVISGLNKDRINKILKK
ncbi:transposase [Bacillota bacterium LX-D]|nr:transposase [Bacillota bacterium LX-D]